MRNKIIIAVSAAAIIAVALTSCKGRRADDTPNGETVEVVIEPTVISVDSTEIVLPESVQGVDVIEDNSDSEVR